MNDAPYGYFPGTRIARKSAPAESHEGRRTCKYCGETDLVWEKQGVSWRLCTIGGERHVCSSVVKAPEDL